MKFDGFLIKWSKHALKLLHKNQHHHLQIGLHNIKSNFLANPTYDDSEVRVVMQTLPT